jgi:hypothetical protein
LAGGFEGVAGVGEIVMVEGAAEAQLRVPLGGGRYTFTARWEALPSPSMSA